MKSSRSDIDWQEAKDIKKELTSMVRILKLTHVQHCRIYCYRSYGSKSRSYARIWSLPKIFQKALHIKPAYVIEVLSEHFDKLEKKEKKKVLLHELLHIPKNFSGALLPHRSRGRHLGTLVNTLFKQYEDKL